MKIIHKPRGKGKTAELIRLAGETQALIICRDPEYVMGLASRMKIKIKKPLGYWAAGNGGLRGRQGSVLIDDADLLLEYLVHLPIKAMTLTKGMTSTLVTLDELRTVLDSDQVDKILAQYASYPLYIPKEVKKEGELVGVIGEHAAAKLSAEFGGLRCYIPTISKQTRRKRNRKILSLWEGGNKVRQIMRIVDVSESTVRHIISRGYA
jgi:Mor family transcriptional regulator